MHRRRAFTLIELIVALAIVALLAAIAIPVYSAVQQRSQINADAAAANAVAQAVSSYYAVNGCYPQPTQQIGVPPAVLVPYLGATTIPNMYYVTANASNQWVSGSGASAYLVYIEFHTGISAQTLADAYVVGSARYVPTSSPVLMC